MVSNVTKNRGVIEQSMRAPVVKLWWEHDKSFPSKRKEEQPFTSQFLKETKPQRQTSHDSFGFENMISPCSKGWTPSMAWQELGWWGPPGHPCPLPCPIAPSLQPTPAGQVFCRHQCSRACQNHLLAEGNTQECSQLSVVLSSSQQQGCKGSSTQTTLS